MMPDVKKSIIIFNFPGTGADIGAKEDYPEFIYKNTEKYKIEFLKSSTKTFSSYKLSDEEKKDGSENDKHRGKQYFYHSSIEEINQRIREIDAGLKQKNKLLVQLQNEYAAIKEKDLGQAAKIMLGASNLSGEIEHYYALKRELKLVKESKIRKALNKKRQIDVDRYIKEGILNIEPHKISEGLSKISYPAITINFARSVVRFVGKLLKWNEKKTKKILEQVTNGKISEYMGMVLGTGDIRNAELTVEVLEKLDDDGMMPKEIVLDGHSRGAVNTIMAANAIFARFDDRVKINMFLTDPVPGPFHEEEWDKCVIPPNVKSFSSFYTVDSKMGMFFKPQSLDKLVFTSKKTVISSYAIKDAEHNAVHSLFPPIEYAKEKILAAITGEKSSKKFPDKSEYEKHGQLFKSTDEMRSNIGNSRFGCKYYAETSMEGREDLDRHFINNLKDARIPYQNGGLDEDTKYKKPDPKKGTKNRSLISKNDMQKLTELSKQLGEISENEQLQKKLLKKLRNIEGTDLLNEIQRKVDEIKETKKRLKEKLAQCGDEKKTKFGKENQTLFEDDETNEDLKKINYKLEEEIKEVKAELEETKKIEKFYEELREEFQRLQKNLREKGFSKEQIKDYCLKKIEEDLEGKIGKVKKERIMISTQIKKRSKNIGQKKIMFSMTSHQWAATLLILPTLGFSSSVYQAKPIKSGVGKIVYITACALTLNSFPIMRQFMSQAFLLILYTLKAVHKPLPCLYKVTHDYIESGINNVCQKKKEKKNEKKEKYDESVDREKGMPSWIQSPANIEKSEGDEMPKKQLLKT